jgi:hypothetical protein
VATINNTKIKACGIIPHKRKKVLKLYDWKEGILCPEYGKAKNCVVEGQTISLRPY